MQFGDSKSPFLLTQNGEQNHPPSAHLIRPEDDAVVEQIA
jgi:hypothetical protein